MRTLHFLLVLCLSLTALEIARADHPGPERVVENKYTIVLTVIPEGDNSLNLIFFFNDSQTGKVVSDIAPAVSITDENGVLVLNRESMEVENGVARLKYTFPTAGLFDIFLEFEKSGEPGKVYRPDKWSLRAPGADGGGTFQPEGLSGLISLGVLGMAVILVTWSFIANRRK